jgi:hypothetical protein
LNKSLGIAGFWYLLLDGPCSIKEVRTREYGTCRWMRTTIRAGVEVCFVVLMALQFAEVLGVEVHVTQLAQCWVSTTWWYHSKLAEDNDTFNGFTHDGRELLSPMISISSSESIRVTQAIST